MEDITYESIEQAKRELPLQYREACPHKLECFKINWEAKERLHECADCVKKGEHSYPKCDCE